MAGRNNKRGNSQPNGGRESKGGKTVKTCPTAKLGQGNLPSISPAAAGTRAVPLPSKLQEYVIKSPMDTKDYAVIHLENGLKALLISTCEHDRNLGAGQINSKTGVYVKVEEFNRMFVNIPDGNVKPKLSRKEAGDDQRNNAKENENENESWEPEVKKGRGSRESSKENVGSSKVYTTLSIGSGFLNDPSDFPGMAHICEHAVAGFGSKNYPDSGGFCNEVQKCGGWSNACTIHDNTIYFIAMDLKTPGIENFERILDVLSDAIENVIIPEEVVNEEVHAVDCEFSLHETKDPLRMWRLLSACAEDAHPCSNFSCGNYKSLGKVNLHEKLLKWKNEHYLANQMTMVVQAELSLDKLEEITRKYFARLPASSSPSPMTKLMEKHGSPFGTKFRKLYHVVPISELQAMFLTWDLPIKFDKNFKTKPLDYLSSFFTPATSFTKYLRDMHWGYEVCGPSFGSQTEPFSSTFTIAVLLTDSGVVHQDEVILALFSYLKMIVNAKPQESLFNDLRREYADNFHYGNSLSRDRSPMMEMITMACNFKKIEESKFALTGPNLVTEFDPKILDEVVKSLTPKNMNVMICSKLFEGECEEVEPWYKTKYNSNEFTKEFLKKCEKVEIYDHFELPRENSLRHKNIICPLGGSNTFDLLRNDNKGRIVHMQFNLCKPGDIPSGVYTFSIASPLMSSISATGTALLEIWVAMMRDKLGKHLYEAGKARTMIMATPTNGNGILVAVIGPPGNQTQTVGKMIHTIMNFEKIADPKSFHDYREFYMKACKTHTLNSEAYGRDLANFVVQQNHFLTDHVQAIVENTSFVDFENFVRSFKDKMFVQSVLVGCVAESEAKTVAELIKAMDYRELPEIFTTTLSRALQLPLGERCIRVKARNPLDQTSRVINHYQFGNLDGPKQSLLRKLAQILHIPAYIQLRNIEHLSYDVRVQVSNDFNVTGLDIQIAPQQHRHTTGYVDERIDNFLAEFRSSTFGSYEKLFRDLTVPPVCTKVEHKILVQLYDEFLLPNRKSFRKLSIQIVGNLDETKTCSSNPPMKPLHIKEKIEKVREGMTPKTEEDWNDDFSEKKSNHPRINVDKLAAVSAIALSAALEIEYDIPNDVSEKNGYFITDVDGFKNSLFCYPRPN